jgi:hypothetical protein
MDDCGLLVNYTQLPEAVCGDIARRFGVEFSPDERERMRDVALYHAKWPRQKFEADGASKRLEASDSVRRAAERWILPHYKELERIRTAANIP